MKVSILLNCIDRYDITKRCVGRSLELAEYEDWELLVCDNGSDDQRVIEYIESLEPVYFRKNETNEGNYQMLNQMLLRASGDAFCIIDNDIMLPKGWLRELVERNKAIPESGVSGVYTLGDTGELTKINGYKVRVRKGAVFGTKFFNRDALDEVGYFCEEYGVYGLGDSDFGLRMEAAGRINYYLPKLQASHQGWDIDEDSDYRRMKDKSIEQHGDIFKANMKKLKQTGKYYIPPPERR